MSLVLLNVGYEQHIVADHILAIIDCKTRCAHRIVQSIKHDKPRALLDLSRNRKYQTLLILDNDTYVLVGPSCRVIARRLEEKGSAILETGEILDALGEAKANSNKEEG